MDINLPDTPAIIETISFEAIKTENIAELKKILPDYEPLESDPFMLLIEAFSYKEMFLRQRINNSIKATLLSTATGTDLDNVAVFYGIERLKGSKPYAMYEFKLSAILDIDVLIPKNTLLTNEDNSLKAHTYQDTIIKAGEKSALAKVILDLEISSTNEKTEIITTPLPYLLKATSKGAFMFGTTTELDEEFRIRILQSLNRFSTAGATGSYQYHTFSADSRIDDVSVLSEKEGIVDIYLASKYAVDDVMIDRVNKALNDEKTRPITDKVNVYQANIISIDIKATIELFDTTYQDAANQIIRENLKRDFKINEDFILSDIIKSLHVNGVYKVNLQEPTTDTLTTQKDVIKINNITLEFVGASYE